MHPNTMEFLANDRMRKHVQDAEHGRLVRAARRRSNPDQARRARWMHRITDTLVRVATGTGSRARVAPYTARPKPHG